MGDKYENGVKEFLGCARAQCDSERAQMGGKQERVEGVEGAREETKERREVDLPVEMGGKSKERLRRDKERERCLFHKQR